MKILAVDIGNTNTVIGAIDQGKILRSWRISTHPKKTSDEIRGLTCHFLEELNINSKDLTTFAATVVSSVVPQCNEPWRRAFSKECNLERETPSRFEFIDYTWPFSFTNLANPPSSVGVDRLVNMEAALFNRKKLNPPIENSLSGIHLQKNSPLATRRPIIVLDSGTATTLCAAKPLEDGNHAYLGGAILPGMELGMEVLASRTALLSTVDLKKPEKAIGKDTTQALRSGIFLGYASMIEGMIERFERELDATEHVPVIATGGVSTLLKEVFVRKIEHAPDLTLEGIWILTQKRLKTG